MNLGYVYIPVKSAKEALAFYRDTLGFDELWREGDETIAIRLPGTKVALMIDEDTTDDKVGPFFVVPDVRAFYEQNAGKVGFLGEPRRIPPGWLASFEDPSGNVIRVMDRTESEERE